MDTVIDFAEASLEELDRRAWAAVEKIKIANKRTDESWWDLGAVLSQARKQFPSKKLFGQWLGEPGREHYGYKKNTGTLTYMRTAYEFGSILGLNLEQKYSYDLLRRIDSLGKKDPERQAQFIERLKRGDEVQVRELTELVSEKKDKAIKHAVTNKITCAEEVPGLTKKQLTQVKSLVQKTITETVTVARKRADEEVKERLLRALDVEKEAKMEKEYWVNKNQQKPLLSRKEYRAMMQACHPDKGGNGLAFNALKGLEPYVGA